MVERYAAFSVADLAEAGVRIARSRWRVVTNPPNALRVRWNARMCNML
jgi:hypothetical protein